MPDRERTTEESKGSGPLAGAEPEHGRPLEDPVLADRSNPRWDERGGPEPEIDAQPLANPDGSPNVMPARDQSADPMAALPDDAAEGEGGTEQDQAARPLDPEAVGRDNIREGRGGGTTNPALAEGGDNG